VPQHKRSPAAKRAPRKPQAVDARDPLFNQSVQKAFAILDAFGGERRALNLGEIAAAVGMTRSSAQRCVLGDEGLPVAAINISAPTRRWKLAELRARFASLLIETARAAAGGTASRLRA
jgi:DNA-binding IclR family transcriptional regulator